MFDDFVAKNIRVRPYSGKDEERRGGEQSRARLSSAELTDEEGGGENYNRIADLEMEEQRSMIKDKLRANLREEQLRKKRAAKGGGGGPPPGAHR